ncbi:MAG: flagellar hook-basal body complex protein [Chromatiales bacterium]|nr:flagellar hook-basal body complex protein [Chromatiales bacterium]
MIRFQGNGTPQQGANTMTFTYSPGNGVPTNDITLNFGEPGSISSDVLHIGWQRQGDLTQSGRVWARSLTKTTFDQQGYLKFSHSNGQTVTGERLALAWFQDLQKLTLEGGGLFQNGGDEKPVIQGAGDDIMGKIVAGKIELSNVDLTEQFTDMVIIQRGYQAVPQVMTVANEMIQQLLEINRR